MNNEQDYISLKKCISQVNKKYSSTPDVERICENYIIDSMGLPIFLLKLLFDEIRTVNDLTEKQQKVYTEIFNDMKRKKSRKAYWGGVDIGKVNHTQTIEFSNISMSKIWNVEVPISEDSPHQIRYMSFWRGKPKKTLVVLHVMFPRMENDPYSDLIGKLWVNDRESNNVLKHLIKLGYSPE